jgi:protein ImuB
LPRFPIDRLNRFRRASSGTPPPDPLNPQVTARKEQSALRIVAVNSAAEGAGIIPGLPLTDARALVPDLSVFPAHPDQDRAALAGLAEWCCLYTPWTASEVGNSAGEAGSGLWLDISGCAHLFGGEEALLDDLLTRLSVLGFTATAAIADTPGAAWAMARFGLAPGVRSVIVPPGDMRTALTRLPVAALRLGPGVAEGLGRLGLRRAGDLYDLPRGPLVTRFGETLIRRVDQALGRAAEPISPKTPASRYRVRLAFAEPISTAEAIEAATKNRLQALCADLEQDSRGARRLELLFFRTDGDVARIAIGTSRPVRDPGHLLRLFREHFDSVDPGFGIDVVILCASLTERLMPGQIELASEAGLALTNESDIAPLIDRLANRLGVDNVVRLQPRESHLPERAVAAVPVLRDSGKEKPSSSSVWPSPSSGASPASRPRPLSLFHPPQPIEAMAPVPDDPPVLFRWRRRVHRIVRAEGPERFGPEWWRESFGGGEGGSAFTPVDGMPNSALTRDYYCVEDSEGVRFWLYRNGVYRPNQQADQQAGQPANKTSPRWYLHGLFG